LLIHRVALGGVVAVRVEIEHTGRGIMLGIAGAPIAALAVSRRRRADRPVGVGAGQPSFRRHVGRRGLGLYSSEMPSSSASISRKL
jgi:hypothetical protein